jgi:hypothetical protein
MSLAPLWLKFNGFLFLGCWTANIVLEGHTLYVNSLSFKIAKLNNAGSRLIFSPGSGDLTSNGEIAVVKIVHRELFGGASNREYRELSKEFKEESKEKTHF